MRGTGIVLILIGPENLRIHHGDCKEEGLFDGERFFSCVFFFPLPFLEAFLAPLLPPPPFPGLSPLFCGLLLCDAMHDNGHCRVGYFGISHWVDFVFFYSVCIRLWCNS